MRLTAMGKIVLLLMTVGVAVGGYRWWSQQSKGAGGSGRSFSLPGIKLPGSGQQGGKAGETLGDNDILFIITPAKKGWVQDQITRFNKEHQGQWRIVTKQLPSREGMHAILAGDVKPVLWSPGSQMWPTRLAEAWSEKHGTTLLDMSDPNAHRAFLRSPLVFLTTRQKAKFLRPLLGGREPWLALRRLSLGQQKTPWGSFRFSHADPLTSSSGLLTLGLILFDYSQRTGQMGSLEKLSTDKRFLTYLSELERGLVYDSPAQEGTTKLAKAFIAEPSRYDVITAYESAALEAAPSHPDIAVIYPNPTAVSVHAVTLLNGDWVTPQQREGALEFVKFLGSPESLRGGLKEHFRPVQSSSALSLNSELSRHATQGFQQSYSTTELPPYEALNSAAYQWRIRIAKKPPTS